nr:MarR family transcriptional regulator [bacterium]
MAAPQQAINDFLVSVFNEILRTEEHSLSTGGFDNVSVKEMHVIEAVVNAQGSDNRATAIAHTLGVTAGTLTTAVNLLEKKGYLSRLRDDRDKRVVRILATGRGMQAYACHAAFHQEMVEDVLRVLSEEEVPVFLRALSGISSFFRAKNIRRER